MSSSLLGSTASEHFLGVLSSCCLPTNTSISAAHRGLRIVILISSVWSAPKPSYTRSTREKRPALPQQAVEDSGLRRSLLTRRSWVEVSCLQELSCCKDAVKAAESFAVKSEPCLLFLVKLCFTGAESGSSFPSSSLTTALEPWTL
jgi:hypothetical protein